MQSRRTGGGNAGLGCVVRRPLPLRPMLLTAISTVLGLIPIAPTVFGGDAFAIMAGAGGDAAELGFLPTLYVIVFRGRPPSAAARA